jgi:hypothetical protein
MLELLHHPSFHSILDEVHDGAEEPTPVRKFGSLVPRPKSHKSYTRTCIEIVSDGVNQFQKHWRRRVHQSVNKRPRLLLHRGYLTSILTNMGRIAELGLL